jgi:hypothetical protein
MTAGEPSPATGQLDFVGALLVADTRAFAEECLSLLSATGLSSDQLPELRERSKTLQLRARAAGIGGLAHHLGLGEECLQNPPPERLEECLRNIQELAWQLEQEIELQRASRARPSKAPPSSPAAVKPELRSTLAPALPPIPAWPGWKRRGAADEVASKKQINGAAAAESLGRPARSSPASARIASFDEAPPPAEGWLSATEPAQPAAPVESTPAWPAVAAASPVADELPSARAPLPESSQGSALAVGSEPVAGPEVAEDQAVPSASEPISEEANASEQAPTSNEPEGVAALSEVLGRVPSTPVPSVVEPSRVAVEAAAELVPGEFVTDEEDELTDDNLQINLDFSRRTGKHPMLLGAREVAVDLPPRVAPPFRKRTRPSRRRWLTAGAAFGLFGGAAAIAIFLFSRFGAHDAELDATTLTRSGALRPVPPGGEEGLYVLKAQVHGLGQSDSPALSQLVDDEVAAMAKALKEPCGEGSQSCALAEQGRQILQQKPIAERAPRNEAAAPWLAGLVLPRIDVPNDARVRSQLQLFVQDRVGREQFQSLLFQCAPFRELFQAASTQRALPNELTALVMAESGCALDSESAAGGRGLWHLTPERARAYHLEVKAAVLDERSSVAKSTDAALDLVNDLYQKLGSWELAIAGYRLGPFNVLARMQQAGRDVTYRDLANAGVLPDDTLNYVAKVEAFAVILANLEHFRFQAPPPANVERATLLLVPAGTRLGLVARAVGTSTSKIRELNPELIADTVPGASGAQFSLQVPGDANPKARDAIDRLIAEGDDEDECVPLNFDWGRQRFTRQMSSRCKR